MKRNFNIASLLTLLACIICLGCQKDDSEPAGNNLKKAVGEWRHNLAGQSSPDFRQTVAGIVGNLDYNAGFVFKTKTGSTVYLVQYKQSGSYLAFYRLEEKWHTTGLIEVVDKGTAANLERIKNTLDRRTLSPGDYVQISDFEGHALRRWERSGEGAYKTSENVVKKKDRRDPNLMRAPDFWTCTDHFWVVYDSRTGFIYSETFMYSECLGGSSADNSTPVYHGNGSGKGNYSTPPAITWHFLETPCFISSVEALVGSALLNEITKQINNLYGNSDMLDLDFREKYDDLSKAAWASEGATQTAGYRKVTVTLNSRVLGIASKEYLYSTILHEMVHAIHMATLPKYQNAEGMSHEMMANDKVISWIANGTRAFFPNLTMQEATELAWGGLEMAEGYKALSDFTKSRITDTNSRYVQGRTGTKCN